MAYCSNCGTKIPEGTKFCPNCGQPVDGGEDQGMDKNVSLQEIWEEEETSGDAAPEGTCGHGYAIAALVLGIVGVVLWFFGYTALISFIPGIIGLVMAGKAKKAGNEEGIRTAGFVLSLIALIGGCIIFLYLLIYLIFVGAAVQGVYDILK